MKWIKKALLVIWNKIKQLFGEKGMEIDETINKWFRETDTMIRNKIKDFGSIDGLCMAVLHSAKDYCCAVLFLLRNGHEMPAKALLRCLCELFVKLNWCLAVSDDIDDKNADIVVERKIRRWEKDTLCRNVEALEKFRDATDKADRQVIEKAISKLRDKPLFSDPTVKRLPNFTTNMIGQLPGIFKNGVYPILYLQFNNAVHLDVTSLVDAYIAKNVKEYGNDSKVFFEYCAAHALYINSTIRMNYGIDVSAIKQEYHNVINTLG